MTTATKQKLIRRILKHKEAIKTADEALVSCLSTLSKGTTNGEVIPCDGEHYQVEDIFLGLDATWRPARVHKYHLQKVHSPK